MIVHTVQPRFFQDANPHYTQGGYVRVHTDVGSDIAFYHLQYHSSANTYTDLFTSASLPSVSFIHNKGVPLHKLVVGKTPNSVFPTGFVSASALSDMFLTAYNDLGWYAGLAYYHYFYDSDGS